MAAQEKCCVSSCGKRREDKVILHKFPNPKNEPDRFRTWTFAVGGNILVLDDTYVYNYRRICHVHFENSYWLGSKRLSNIAVPTLQLKGVVANRNPLREVTNQSNVQTTYAEASTSDSIVLQTTQEKSYLPVPPVQTDITLTARKKTIFEDKVRPLQKLVKGLNIENKKFASRVKDALNLSKNRTFQSTLKKFTSLAALFTVLQFRECNKGKMGRRFTTEEKIMGLTIYKRGPRCYRLLRKIFILPSPVTLSRMVSRARLKPGINENLFQQLKRRARKMKPDDRLCTLIFDKMSISPHFDYNKKNDRIVGFVDNGTDIKNIIADHVLVFMIRGVFKNYKQPISYSFCSGSTKHADLAVLIKSHISKLHSIGFKVLATVCDQGASNVSAINHLIEERRIKCLKRNVEMRHSVFEVDGEEIIPLYDVPHLLKGIRNNLLTKNLKYILNGTVKIAKWDHIVKLYQNNPTYKGIRIIKKLTENHCTPEKIPKMKVKYATQIFSQTVGVNMGYLADQGLLPGECNETADFILFMDSLFDSFNGSYGRQKSGKSLLQPLTPKSAHNQHWIHARTVLNSMSYINKTHNNTSPVPSVKNWLRTIENFEYLRDVLFNRYNIKSIWCRHFNQDPLENFFGSVRSHGYRNNSPTCAGFEAAFASLLVNNLSSNYSPGSNCEQDTCYVFKSLKKLFLNSNEPVPCENVQIDLDDVLNDEIVIDINTKKKDPRIFAALEYVTGYILSRLRCKVFKNCKECKKNLYKNNKQPDGKETSGEVSSYIRLREFNKNKRRLSYPSDQLVKAFSEIQDIIHHIIKEKSSMKGIKHYIKLVLYSRINTTFIKCDTHKDNVIEVMFNIISTFFLCNWCRDLNKILSGSRRDIDPTDIMQVLSSKYTNKRRKW